MSKGQRGNKEAKKPKKAPVKAVGAGRLGAGGECWRPRRGSRSSSGAPVGALDSRQSPFSAPQASAAATCILRDGTARSGAVEAKPLSAVAAAIVAPGFRLSTIELGIRIVAPRSFVVS